MYKNFYSKYHAKRTTIDGITFASKKEANRYQQLKLLEKTGVIKDLQLQVPYVLIEKSKYGRAIKYIADFVYLTNNDSECFGVYSTKVVEDCKGFKTDIYKLKKRLMAEKYGIEIKES